MALDRHQNRTGQPLHTVLKSRSDRPELKSPELAALLTAALGKPVTAGWVRQALVQAREVFVGALIEAVRATLDLPTRAAILEELTDVGLLEYCRPVLERRGWLG